MQRLIAGKDIHFACPLPGQSPKPGLSGGCAVAGLPTIRLIKGKGLTSEAICRFTWSPYSHCEFLVMRFGVPYYLGAQTNGGVALRPVDYCEVVAEHFFIANNISWTDSQQVLQFALDQIGKPYDFAAIAGFAFHRDWHDPDRWFCSELVCASFDVPFENRRQNDPDPRLLVVDHHENYRLPPGAVAMSPMLREIL